MWLAIEFEDFPGWFDWQKMAFDLIQSNLLPLGGSAALFTSYMHGPRSYEASTPLECGGVSVPDAR